ncbi:MAG TPA: sarcosine oxidase subunit gamma family protein [Acidimicrobiales bacterium]|nr:sarcosine oxidase subunit gamma family protein [Acidimicrobiales bacterium]
MARSPVRPEAPVAAHEGWEVSRATSSSSLRLSDLTPLTKVLVRTKGASPMAVALGCKFGRAMRNAQGHLVAGTGPDEWLVIAPAGAAETVFAGLEGSDQPELATVLDLTHGGVLFRLTGSDAARLLEKVCAIDFSDAVTPDGAVFRSSLARVTTDVVRDDVAGVRSYLLHSDRSSGQYQFDALLDAGAEFDIAVDGYPEKEI